MKKIWVPTLILFLIFSLISCGNGKNGNLNNINQHKENDKKGIQFKFDIDPYPWISMEPLIENTNINKSGSWLFVLQEIKKIGSMKFGYNVGERPVLFIIVEIVNYSNLNDKRDKYYSELPQGEYVSYLKGGELKFRKNKSIKDLTVNRYYNENGKIKDEIQVVILFVTNFVLDNKIDITKDTDFFRDQETHWNYKIFKTYSNTPIYIGQKNFVNYYIHSGYFKASDLNIKSVDLYGNIQGIYGEKEFILPHEGEWISNTVLHEIPRKYFKYDWPEYKDGNWDYKKETLIRITGKKQIMKMRGKYKTWVQDFKIICELKNPDKYLLKKSGSGTSIPSYSKDEILEIINHIKQKYPDIEINGMDRDWEWYSITKIDYEGKIKKYLPIMGNPKFVTQIRIINHGWMVYYY